MAATPTRSSATYTPPMKRKFAELTLLFIHQNKKVQDSKTLDVWDHMITKQWAIKLASDAAITILRVDQIIVAKPAGGPKPKQNNNWDDV
jgi:hypothetical protein